jgi:hypothetical protein
MPLTKLQFRPGIDREATSYADEGGWFDMDKVRFRMGFPEKIGGWTQESTKTFLGTCRAIHPWITLSGSQYLGVGTNLKYYVNEGGGYNDITPIRYTTAAGDVTFSASANTLASSVAVDDTTISLTSSSGFPTTGRIKINSEIITYAALSGNDLIGCSRGQNGTTAAAHTSSTAVNCSTIIVDDVGHGALTNDFVTFSGATTLGDAVTAVRLNQEYQIVHVENTDQYYIDARVVSSIASITTTSGLEPDYVFATSSDSGNGGASVVGAYQINSGLDTSILGSGWGAGPWGRGSWGSAASATTSGEVLRTWSHDNFGEDLLFNPRGGGIYYLDSSAGLGSRAVSLDSLAGANTTPTIANEIMVSDNSRHILAFGCDGEFTPGVQDPLLIRFSSQESLTDWSAQIDNSAGDLRIGSGSEIVTAIETKQQILVFTDVSLHSLQYLGPPYTFGLSMLSDNIAIAGPNAVTSAQDTVYWMGKSEFYSYSGSVQRVPCTVRDYVFNNFNYDQSEKVYATTVTSFSEVWWFYPSASSNENDRYVVYNYQQNIWYYGTMTRTAGIDRGMLNNPLFASTDHYLYYHEDGFDDGSVSPAIGINAYIESAQMSIQSGDNFAFISRVIPDITFRNSTSSTPTVDFTVKTRNFPGGAYLQSNDEGVTKTASVPVEQFTNQLYMRLRGRSFAFRVDSTETGVAWRLGIPRVDIRQDGRR